MPKFDIPEGAPGHVLEQLLGKDWSELSVLEYEDYLLFPDVVLRRRGDGKFEKKEIMLRVPRERDIRKARIQARKLASADGMDLDRDRDLIENLERICILAISIRTATPPHEPWEPDPLGLEKRYDDTSLAQLWSKLDKLRILLDPAPDTISEGEAAALIALLASVRHLGPLAVYGPDAQTSFILSMVDRLVTSEPGKSSSEPSEP